MNGDLLADLVLVGLGRIEYWPGAATASTGGATLLTAAKRTPAGVVSAPAKASRPHLAREANALSP